jgi:hypothetical protein
MKKDSIQDSIDPNFFPFTENQFKKFREELDEAGGFDELMFKKKAFSTRGNELVAQYYDIEAYKEKFLTGEYESLKEFFDTEIPYEFWSMFYETLRRWEDKNEA